MDPYTAAWILWFLAFAAIEATALVRKDRPGAPATLSAHIWWLVRGAGPWHQYARVGLGMFLAWLGPHLLGADPTQLTQP